MRDLKKKLKNLLFAVSIGHGVNSPTSLPDQTGNSGKFLTTNGAQPSWATLSGSSFGAQLVNTVLAGPSSGGSAAPTFRALVLADLPSTVISGTLTATRIPYALTASTLGDSANMVWDNTNNKVTLTNAGVGVSQKTSLVLSNTTAATAGTQQASPSIEWAGQGWKTNTSSSVADKVIADVLPISSLITSSRWRLRASDEGGSLTDMFYVDSKAAWNLNYPKIYFPGITQQSINLTGGSEYYDTIVNASSVGKSNVLWTFNGVGKASNTYDFGGYVTHRSAGNSSGFEFRYGSTIDNTFPILQITNVGLYNYGKSLNVNKVTAGTGYQQHGQTLAVAGSIGLKQTTITSDTTLANDLPQSIHYCDTTNAANCTGTPSSSCASYGYDNCNTYSDIGCSQQTDGTCSDNNNTDSSTCTSANAACSWEAIDCDNWVNNQSACENAGYPSAGQCSFSQSSCSSFFSQFSPSLCTDASCSANYGTACSVFTDQSSCDAYSSIGCSSTLENSCNTFDGTDQGTCETNYGCAWDSGFNTCNGNYFSSCSGNYYDSCTGSYSGPNGSCTGTYNTGACNGGVYGSCAGTALCSNLTGFGSGTCASYGGCAWTSGLTITLPQLSNSAVNTDSVHPMIWFKKTNAGAGSCTVAAASGDTIEGSSSTALASQYDKLVLHPRYLSSSCSTDFSNNRGGCESAGCSFDECSGIGNSDTCGATNGCTWDGFSCTGTLGPNGNCYGTYVIEKKWYKY